MPAATSSSKLPAHREHALARLDRYLEAALRAHAFPGAVVAFGHADEAPTVRCYGHLAYEASAPVTPGTRYDLLCMTKPMSIGAVLARAVAEDGFDLDARVAHDLPELARAGKGGLTWRHLLTHSGGLAPSHSYDRLPGRTREEVIAQVLATPPRFEAGTKYEYSCDGFILMGLALERRTGMRLDELVTRQVFEPLGMRSAAYGPASAPLEGDIAPTHPYRVARTGVIRGTTCEPLAAALGGIAASSGIFASADDVARFARAWLGHAPRGTTPLFDPRVTARFQRVQDPQRLGTTGLAWDTRSPAGYTVAGRAFGPRSFGHTGASGCSMWLDPESRTYVVLLSNAVYDADGQRRYVWVRPRVSELVAAALRADA